MTEDMFADMAGALGTKSGIVAYVRQARGTSSDVMLFDRDNMDTAAEIFQAASKVGWDLKYMDMTSSADNGQYDGFAKALEGISAGVDVIWNCKRETPYTESLIWYRVFFFSRAKSQCD